jgi:hypothetical protein
MLTTREAHKTASRLAGMHGTLTEDMSPPYLHNCCMASQLEVTRQNYPPGNQLLLQVQHLECFSQNFLGSRAFAIRTLGSQFIFLSPVYLEMGC